jgi:hypothetical protein
MLPPFDDGVLPDGVHDATPAEVVAAFGRFQRTDGRPRLTDRLVAYLEDARRSGIVAAIVIDGSYVTAKDDPEDVDLIVVIRPEVDVTRLRPFEYNTISKRMIRSLHKFDAVAVYAGDSEELKWLNYFSQVNPLKPHPYTSRVTKGLVRVVMDPK